MRQRDERFADQARHKQGEVLYDKRGAAKPIKVFKPVDFIFHDDKTASCPAGRTLTGTGATYGQRGHCFQRYQAAAKD